ncbi:HTH domain-containing protein [Streptosporangium canum]|uniref:HTH domain-containing protein n=1 Tax=Streptosporangium canum TaxID=324952 RepID=UPI0036A21BAF
MVRPPVRFRPVASDRLTPTTTDRLLAERLGVTVRTVERDIVRLREAGAPIAVRSVPGGGMSGAVGPEELQSGDGGLSGHPRDLRLAETDPRDQKMDEVGGERLGRDDRHASVRLLAFLHAFPELVLCDIELITENVRPFVIVRSGIARGIPPGSEAGQAHPVARLRRALRSGAQRQRRAHRDSKAPDGPKLFFTPSERDAFVGGVKLGEFDD